MAGAQGAAAVLANAQTWAILPHLTELVTHFNSSLFPMTSARGSHGDSINQRSGYLLLGIPVQVAS